MPALRTRLRLAAIPLLAPVALGVLTACTGANNTVDEQLRADLTAAAQAPGYRQPYASPMELGYPQGYVPGGQQGYAPYPGQNPQPYPQPYPPQAYGYPQPYPQQAQTRVVYVPQAGTVRRTGTAAGSGSASGGGSGTVYGERRQTQKGAIIGAASGAAIGVLSSRDKAKGAAIGALGGAVLGGLIGHQVKNPN